jgi:hypothetical protein
MKSGKFVIFLGLIVSIFFFSCVGGPSAKPLDKSEISGPVTIYSGSFVIRADAFEDIENKELFQTAILNNIETIKSGVFEEYQIILDDEEFLDGLSEIDAFQFENINFVSFKIKRYYLKDMEKNGIYAELVLTGVVLEDGTMPLEINIKKDDPEYEPGYQLKINLRLKSSE